MTPTKPTETNGLGLTERLLGGLVYIAAASDAQILAGGLMKVVRFRHRDRPIQPDSTSDEDREVPQGPFLVDDRRGGALLIYIPRNVKSRLIDDATGGYGYSHVAVDCGEVDQKTHKAVMTESTTADVVHRSFQDKYGRRPFIRIPLKELGVDPKALRECVNDKLGERYDDKEALTWGKLKDPAKQICSDLAAGCLPDDLREDIARARRHGEVRVLSVSVHRRATGRLDVFVSPNGFSEYFGAPHGSKIKRRDQLFHTRRRRHPRPLAVALMRRAFVPPLAPLITALISLVIVVRIARSLHSTRREFPPLFS